MSGYLAALDREVAWLFSLGDAGTTTVFLSDHGMSRQPNSLFSNWHSGPGLIFARGPGLQPGAKLGSLPPEEIRPFLMKILSGEPPASL